MANHKSSRYRGPLKISWAVGICLCFLAGALVINAPAQPNQEECFDKKLNAGPTKYLKQQQEYNYGLVYSTCWAGKNSKLILLLPLSNHSGLDDILGGPREPPPRPRGGREAGVPTLFYYYKGCVTNAASFKVGKDSLSLVDYAQGGMWQADRLGDAADELASFPLSFLPPAKVMEALKANPVRECRSLSKVSAEVP